MQTIACNYTSEDLLFIQISSLTTPVHCYFLLGKMLWPPLLSAAGQHRLTAGLCHCNHTYEVLVIRQVKSHQTCGTAGTHLKIFCSYRSAVSQHQCTANLFWAICIVPPLLSAAVEQRVTMGLCHCNHMLLSIQFAVSPHHGHKQCILQSAVLQCIGVESVQSCIKSKTS